MGAWLERLGKIWIDLGARAARGSGRAGDPEGVLQKAGDDPDRPSTPDVHLSGRSEEPANTPVDSAPAVVEPEVGTEPERPRVVPLRGGSEDYAGPWGDVGAVRGAILGGTAGDAPAAPLQDCKPPADAPSDAEGDVLDDTHDDAPSVDDQVVHGCKVCNHPELQVIDAKEDKGQSARSVAKEHKLSEASVRRHRRHRPATGRRRPASVGTRSTPEGRPGRTGALGADAQSAGYGVASAGCQRSAGPARPDREAVRSGRADRPSGDRGEPGVAEPPGKTPGRAGSPPCGAGGCAGGATG